MTTQDLKKATQDSDVLLACKALFMAMAYEETLSEKIIPKQTEILRNYGFKSEDGEIIDEPKKVFLLSDIDFQTYWKEMNQYYDSLGLKRPSYDHCPLLMAQSQKREAEKNLLQTIEKYTGLDIKKMTMAHIDTYLEITLKFLAQHV